MSCGSLKHRFEDQMRNGISFETAMEIYRDVEGSIAAHRAEMADLQKANASQDEINHLKEHIAEGESLIQRIKSMKLH
ncbi:MAG: hypothetical protein K6T66_14900 [Peptococcaceae bacterium]|nr:hypothetical protein [Peptococcaceae bacterium]